MARFVLGLLWALGTSLLVGFAVGSFIESLGGDADGLSGAVAGFFGMLAWITYRVGSNRFLSRPPALGSLPRQGERDGSAARGDRPRVEPQLRA